LLTGRGKCRADEQSVQRAGQRPREKQHGKIGGYCRKDVAGNTGTATITVKVDKTNPAIVATAKKADGSAYTFGQTTNQAVTVHYACTDAGSLISSCTDCTPKASS